MSIGFKTIHLIKGFTIKITQTLLIIISLNCSVNAQERKLFYDVMRNGKVIGHINFVEINQGQKRYLSMISEVKTSFIFSFSDHTAESAVYENGVLILSTYYQKQTGSSEVNKSTIASGKFYKVSDKGVTKLINLSPIHFGMLLMFTHVPDTVNKIFSGNYQQMLDLKKIDANKYKLIIPDGKYNIYTYTNGVCSKVEIVRSLVSLQFVLKGIK